MIKFCCKSYHIKSLLGIFNNSSTANQCPEYCQTVSDIESLPRPEDCPSLLAFVADGNSELGGFIYDPDGENWLQILVLIEVIYSDTNAVSGIKGELLPDWELIINGKAYSPEQVFSGIVFPIPLRPPIKLIYSNNKTGCLLQGQTIPEEG